jgi:hypothetical protein
MGSKSPPPQQTTGTTTQQTLSSPSIEAALSLFTPQLMGMLSGNIQTDTFAPRVAAQNQLQQAAIVSGLRGQGFDFDPATGAVTGYNSVRVPVLHLVVAGLVLHKANLEHKVLED